MKNLANCKPTEFLRQTSRIRKSVEKWIKVTDIENIRKNVPVFEKIPEDTDVDEVDRILTERKKAIRKASTENLTRILDSIMDEHPDETLELLALLNFVEPKDVDKHPMSKYLANLTEMINDGAVIDFFTSLVRLERTGILSA